jgi:SAM-dependent methyltransferase
VTSDSDTAAVKARQRAMWSAGDYDSIATFFWDVGAIAVEAAAIEPPMAVLDVATGTGNAAVRAAQAGADVTGLDLTPELFEAARQRAAEAGVTVEWVEGDAEALPFDDASFDRVLSTFGVMFAPRQQLAAAELARVCRPGGRVVLASWTPDGFLGRVIGLLVRQLPLPPGSAAPALWGDERHVRKLLGGQLLLDQEPHTVDFRFASVDAMVAEFERAFGPFALGRKVLGDEGFAVVRDGFRALIDEFGTGDGETRVPSEYLLTVAHRPGA